MITGQKKDMSYEPDSVHAIVDERSKWYALEFFKWKNKYPHLVWDEGRGKWWNGSEALSHDTVWESFKDEYKRMGWAASGGSTSLASHTSTEE